MFSVYQSPYTAIVLSFFIAVISTFSSRATSTEMLITVSHNSQHEAALFNGFSRHNVGSKRYQSAVAANALVKAIARDYNLQLSDIAWQIHSLDIYCVVVDIPENKNVQHLIQQIESDPRIDSIQPMYSYATHTASPENANRHALEKAGNTPDELRYNDTYFNKQYGNYQNRVEALHRQSTGHNIKMAIIDTAADLDHSDLPGAHIQQRNLLAENRKLAARDTHGTAVLGVIAAVPNNGLGIVGLAPEAKIDMLRACWYTSDSVAAQCSSLTIAAALDFAIENEVEIINLSLSGPRDPLIARLVAVAQQNDIVIIASDPLTGNRRYPARLPGVLSVSSSQNRSTNNEAAANTGGVKTNTPKTSEPVIVSEAGYTLNLPANDVISTAPGNSFDFYSGSSISAALVSALFAHSIQQHPDLQFDQHVEFIQQMLVELGLAENSSQNKRNNS